MKATGIFMVILLLCTTGCASLVVGGAGAGGYYAGKDERSVGRITEDAQITSSINAKYVRDSQISAMDINVDTYNGVVTLHGHVNSVDAEARALSLARSTKGVKQVISRLSVVR